MHDDEYQPNVVACTKDDRETRDMHDQKDSRLQVEVSKTQRDKCDNGMRCHIFGLNVGSNVWLRCTNIRSYLTTEQKNNETREQAGRSPGR